MFLLLIISRMNFIPKLLLKLEEITFIDNGSEWNREPEKKRIILLIIYNIYSNMNDLNKPIIHLNINP